ncbi:discoidin domain-containing protein [Paenibacillus psychroresistens]|nr:discoidin domain-containing protein [Paenibacillus psychroresistens]
MKKQQGAGSQSSLNSPTQTAALQVKSEEWQTPTKDWELWRLGQADGEAQKSVSTGIAAQNILDAGMNAAQNADLNLQYTLKKIPANGVLFHVKINNASKAIPQMAVFSNQQLSGIIQIAGVEGADASSAFHKTYELYIPKEMLKLGANELKLQAIRCLYCSASESKYLWWTWDELGMTVLNAPAQEPIHGSYIQTGTNVNNNQYYYDDAAVMHLPYVMKWLGIAYSGNIMRTGCASNIGKSCEAIDSYYETLKDYNMQAVSFHLFTGNVKLKADGSLSDVAQQTLKSYLEEYGSSFQYYEVDNEPGLFNRSKAVDLAVAEWLNKNRAKYAPSLKIVAPGWSYSSTYAAKSCKNQIEGESLKCGDPDGWERDPKQRMELEYITDLTNGHSYGDSYSDSQGGSLVENIKSFSGAADGLPKPMLNTEFGTSDTHKDKAIYGASQKYSAIFDRIFRAHVGFADMFVQHAAFFPDFSLFKTGYNLENHNPAKTEIYYNQPDTDSRVGVMRRLNLAYATHGKPLAYQLDNKADLADKLVYFRAVDTSKLQPLPVTNAVSNKILLNFVNFDTTTQVMDVKVTMPKAATYEGERFGKGDTYEAARSYVTGLKASPEINIKETLAPGESVQYILQLSEGTVVKPPSWVSASPGKKQSIQLNWLESEGAHGYNIKRGLSPNGPFEAIAENISTTSYLDNKTEYNTHYYYVIQAVGAEGVSAIAEITTSDLKPLDRTNWQMSSNTVGTNYKGAIDDNKHTRWDTGAHQVPDQYFQIDLGIAKPIERITMDSADSLYDFPKSYEVFTSEDDIHWTGPMAAGEGTRLVTVVSFPPKLARYVKIIQKGYAGKFWSIHDLQIYAKAYE